MPQRSQIQVTAGAYSRRAVIQGGLIAAAGLVIAGCESATRTGSVPGPLWPDQERSAGESRVGARPSAPPIDTGTIPAGVLPRKEWTNAGPNYRGNWFPMNGVKRITVHHDALVSVGLTSKMEVARRIESIRSGHRARGAEWVDIGYHYLIDPAGRIWQGRSVSLQGGHVKDQNEHNLGIVVMGNFDQHKPTPESLAALDLFVADQMRRYRVPISRVFTHQELAPTACPGRFMQRYMLATRSSSGRLALV